MVGESMRRGIGDWEGLRKLDRWIGGQVAGKSLGLRIAG